MLNTKKDFKSIINLKFIIIFIIFYIFSSLPLNTYAITSKSEKETYIEGKTIPSYTLYTMTLREVEGDGEDTSSRFTPQGKLKAEYVLTNNNDNPITWKLFREGFFKNIEITSGTLNANSSSGIFEIPSTKNKKYYFYACTNNDGELNVKCEFKEIGTE